ncbi:MAG: PDZ domain-containing protein [Blastocatellia bacterium]|nr:PDZ domain-containing protein [Blastocatellia bacterium]
MSVSFPKFVSTSCLVLSLTQVGVAQTQPEQPVPAPGKKTVAPVSPRLSTTEARIFAPWLVTVAHSFTLGEVQKNLPEGVKINSVDAVEMSQVEVTNITTGLVMDGRGYVLTNLVNLNPEKPPTNLTVVTADRRELPARFVGLDGVTGLAVLRVNGLLIEPPDVTNDFTLLKPEDEVRLWVPSFEVKPTKTSRGNLVSRITPPEVRVSPAKIERISPTRMEVTFEPPSVAGEEVSAGVVLSKKQQVLGLAQTATNNLLRVLPITLARQAFQRVLKLGRNVPRGWLGIGGKDLKAIPAEEREKRHITVLEGVLVENVLPHSPAALAGIQNFDVVSAVEGHPLPSLKSFLEMIDQNPAGTEFQLTIWREGKQFEKTVTLGERELTQTFLQSQQTFNNTGGQSFSAPKLLPPQPQNEQTVFGLETTDMTAQLAAFFGVPVSGVLVNTVIRGSLAELSGFQAGDVIVEMKGKKTPFRTQYFEVLLDGLKSFDQIQVVRNKKLITLTLGKGRVQVEK